MYKIIIYNFVLIICLAGGVSAQNVVNADAAKNSVIANFNGLNTSNLEFSPVNFGDGLVYVSSKEKEESFDYEINESFFDLKFFGLNSEAAKAEDFSNAINISNLHIGPISFSQQERVMYYTTEKRFKGEKPAVLQILKAFKDEGDWIPGGIFPYNSDDYSNTHPTLSPDGSFMIFSSNKPGGLGGHDLYISTYENGYWTEPVNLGSAVNTFGNELFPYVHDNGTLVFSSNGRGGLGKLDLFASRKEGEQWLVAESLGAPLNSAADDFGVVINSEGTEGYLSSDREGGEGKDDIYSFTAPASIFSTEGAASQPSEQFQFSTMILDKNSKDPVGNAEVYAFPFSVDGTDLVISNFDIQAIDAVSDSENIILTLKPNDNINAQHLAISDENGKASFVLDRAKRYYLYAQKSGYQSGQTAINAQDVVPEINILLTSQLTPVPTPVPVSTYVPQPYTIEQALDRRELVVFNEIYYDHNSATLRAGATSELDLLADYLLKNPALRVELTSYTDARGRRDYNQDLSLRRAQSAKSYLVRRGISDFRIVASGRGENNIRNHCANGVTCSDEEHEYNRRTEVEILDN